jgi:hypothetical protein
MKGMKYGVDNSGKVAVVLMIDGNKVKLLSEDTKFSGLNGKAMMLKVSGKVGGIIADGTKMVKPGEVGYHDAVIDTLEGMGIDVVG